MAMEGSFADEHSDRRVRIVSQLAWPGRTEDELVACSEHEALVNAALEGHQATVLCLYDASRLDDDVLTDARATHPVLWKCGALHRSAEYAPDDVLARCNRPLPGHPGAVTYMVRTSSDLRPARSFAVSYAGWIGLSQDGTDDLQLIATELATNSLMYTDGACRLAFWRNDEHLVCEARDTGRARRPAGGTPRAGLQRPRQPRIVSGQRHVGLGAHAYDVDRYDDPGLSSAWSVARAARVKRAEGPRRARRDATCC